MGEYPYHFYVESRMFRHRVMVTNGPDVYSVSRYFWSKITALYIASYLTQWFRNGVDIGRKTP